MNTYDFLETLFGGCDNGNITITTLPSKKNYHIPVAEIEKKVSEIKKEEEKESSKKVYSPYTRIREDNKNKSRKIIYIVIAVFVVILIVLIALLVKNKISNVKILNKHLLISEI